MSMNGQIDKVSKEEINIKRNIKLKMRKIAFVQNNLGENKNLLPFEKI